MLIAWCPYLSRRFRPQPTKELCVRLTSRMPRSSLAGDGQFPRPNGLQHTFHKDQSPSERKRGAVCGPYGPPEGSALTRCTFMSLSFPARTEPEHPVRKYPPSWYKDDVHIAGNQLKGTAGQYALSPLPLCSMSVPVTGLRALHIGGCRPPCICLSNKVNRGIL